MRAARALAWLACVGACAGQSMTKASPRAAKQDAVDAQAPGLTAREAAAEMIKSRLATQTTRPVFERGNGRRLQEGHSFSYSFSYSYSDAYDDDFNNPAPTAGPSPRPASADDGCVDDLTTTGSLDENCLDYYYAPEFCGDFDDEDFKASEQCCACGGGEGTFAPTTAAPTAFFDGVHHTDESIRTAVALWLSDSTAAEAEYGHISTWETGEVTDMSCLFVAKSYSDCANVYNSGAASFNEDISGWDTSEVTDMSFMFSKASAFNQPIGDWRVDKVAFMDEMFFGASGFDQVLGWCVPAEIAPRAFKRTICEASSCGVVEGICPDPEAATGEHCKLSDPELCSGSRYSFVEAPSNPFASIENRYAVPTLADDRDGTNELLVGRKDGALVLYRQAESGYQLVVGDEDPFKSVAVGGHAAPALVDLDGDGDLDLVLGAADGSLTYFRNDGSNFLSIEGPFSSISVGAHSAPAFADLDGDGLKDLVLGKETSGALTYYRNVGSHTKAKFQVVSDGPFENVVVGSFSKPTFYDLDNDGDQDLIVGERLGEVLLFLNVGSRYAPEFAIVESPLAGSVRTYAAPTFGVLNGVPSLVVGSAPGQLVVYSEALVKLEFSATRTNPFDGTGVGEYSKPTFVDLDNDGDMDLVVGESDGTLIYYRNVGTPSQPNFEKVQDCSPMAGSYSYSYSYSYEVEDDDGVERRLFSRQLLQGPPPLAYIEGANPFCGIDVGGASAPTFADLDDDGDKDLVVGDVDGRLNYYRNVGTPSKPKFAQVEEASPFDGIDVNGDERFGYSTPAFVDVDNDGDLDLVLGEVYGTLLYYRNVGTPLQPKFEKVEENSSFEGIDVGYISAPTLVDLDDDGDKDLVVGEGSGVLHYYRNVGTASQPSFKKVGEESHLDISIGVEASAPTFVDIDSDGDLDLVVGDEFGRLSYFQNAGSCRKGLEVGACSGNGICGAYQGGKATCECLFTFQGDQCDSCREGHIGFTCEPCKKHTFSIGGPPLADNECMPCPAGMFSAAGAFTCELCPAGEYRSAADVEVTVCIPCDGDTWSKSGQPCDECTKDYYRAKGGGCEKCAPDMICDEPFVTEENVECEKGFYKDKGDYKDADAVCKECTTSMNNLDLCQEPGVLIGEIRLGKNHWRTSANSDKIEKCLLKDSCRSTGHDTNVPDAGEALCTKGHEGPLCAVCKRHYYRLGQECIKCRPSTIAFTVIGVLVGIVVFLAFFLMAMTYSNLAAKGVGKSFEKSQESEVSPTRLSRQGSTYFARADSAVQKSNRPDPKDVGSGLWQGLKRWLSEGNAADALRRNVTTFVKQLSGTYSIFVNLPWVFDIKFPNLYEKVLERLAIVNVNMSFSLECVMSRKVTFQDQLLAATIGPIAAILLVIGLGVLWLGFKRNEHKHRKDRKRTTIMVLAQLVLLILFLSYTSTSTIIFRAFRPCDRLDEKYHGSNLYMHDDYSVSCKSSRYVFIVTWAALMLLVYPIGIPLVSFCLMWRHQEKLNPTVDSNFIDRDINFGTVGESESAFRQACVEKKTELRNKAVKAQDRELVSFAQLFHFMYDNYEPRYWWFECFDYIRRLALTGLMVIILPGSALQGFIGVLIALCGLLAYVQWKPFKEDASDWLGVSTQLSTFFLFLSALMVQVNAVYHRRGFGVLLTVVTFLPPFVSLCAALRELNFLSAKEPGSNEDSSSNPAKDDVADPESSPQSPLARNAPPQEDEEAPAAPPAQN